ncbi:MAG TPA: VOC family protein [Nitrospiria bacterium]|nr:VOC family protein [Nitrospiria bacterium]
MAKGISDSWVMAESKDIKRSVAFYSKLGFKPSMRMAFYAEFKVPGGTVLGLHSMGGKKGKRGGKPNGGWGIMLRVKGIEKMAAGLKRRGVRLSPVRTAPGGAMFSSFADPDGNRLTLVQMGR